MPPHRTIPTSIRGIVIGLGPAALAEIEGATRTASRLRVMQGKLLQPGITNPAAVTRFTASTQATGEPKPAHTGFIRGPQLYIHIHALTNVLLNMSIDALMRAVAARGSMNQSQDSPILACVRLGCLRTIKP